MSSRLDISFHQIDDASPRFLERVHRERDRPRGYCRFQAARRPSASLRQFMLLAVNMPLHEPQVGQAFSSMSCRVLSDILLADTWPTASKTVARSIAFPSLLFPRLHRPATHEDCGDIHSGDAQHHAWNNFVAIGNADDAGQSSAPAASSRPNQQSALAMRGCTSCQRGPSRCRHQHRWY